MKPSYDCVVLGGGPAGSAVATLVARAGFSTLLVERERMPRFHVGESLMPEAFWTLRRLGVLDQLRSGGFVEKFSVQFVSGNGKESEPFYFAEHDPRECSQTWQVERSRFDEILFRNASAAGAECVDQTRVLRVEFHGDRAERVLVQTRDTSSQNVAARVVVDATGQRSLIATQLGLRQPVPDLRKAAIWTYFHNAERLPGEHGGATLILHTKTKDAWFWYIPLSGDITSVGVVSDMDRLLRGRGSSEEVFLSELEQCPGLQRRLARGERSDAFHVAKEFSYTTTRHSGDNWVLVGDAFGFIDPIYSSGVFFALKTGEMAADCIIDSLRDHDVSADSLGRWTDSFKNGAQWVRQLVETFYSNSLSFGGFAREYPEHRGHVTDILIGRVFDRDMSDVFAAMRARADVA